MKSRRLILLGSAVLFGVVARAATGEVEIFEGGLVRRFRPVQQELRAASAAGDSLLVEVGKRKPLVRRLTGELLVELAPGADASQVAAESGATRFATTAKAYIFYAGNAQESLALREKLRTNRAVLSAEAILAKQRVRKAIPNDPLFPRQWHLHNSGSNGARAGVDLNVTNTWNSFRGTGVVIGIVDDGIDTTHPDLAAHLDPSLGYDWNDNDSNPAAHPENGDFHGTECAGAAAAIGNNSQGVTGVAYEATLAGLRLIGGDSSDVTEAAAIIFKNDSIAIKSNSWGPEDDGQTLEGPGPLGLLALEESIRNGRQGHGTIFVWPAGNGLDAGDDANYDGFANSIYTIAVGSVSDQGFQTDYGEPGACVLISTPGASFGRRSITTTDLQGSEGENSIGEPNDYADLDYTRGFNGTSASVALASGGIALILQANPNLGWRDVQEILIRSARTVDEHDSEWEVNSAGLHFNHKFGAGLMDVGTAVTLAQNWENLAQQTNAVLAKTLNVPLSSSAPLAAELDLSRTRLRVEHVTLTVEITHPSRGDLAITLISPSGLESRLAEAHDDPGSNYASWKFMSVRHWGESSQGIWKVRISDGVPGNDGMVKALRLEVFGTEAGDPNKIIGEIASVSDTSGGNGNGGAEPGETVAAVIRLRNTTAEPVAGTVELISRDSGVTVLTGAASFPAIPGGNAFETAAPFQVRIGESIPCGATLLFDIVTVVGTDRATNTVRQKVGAPPAKWSIETVDREGVVGSYTSLAVDPRGKTHISYYDVTKADLKYAYQTNGTWMVQAVDSTGDVGLYSSLALDVDGKPRIAYRDSTARQLKYAAWTGNGWNIETIVTPQASGNFCSLALTTDGEPRIAFQDELNRDLLYAAKVAGEWRVEPVDPVDNTGSDISLALNSRDEPIISYRNVTDSDLKVAEKVGGSWKLATVDAEGSVGFNTSIEVGQDDEPRVAYRDSTNSDLKFAQRANGVWKLTTVDSSGAVGSDADLALDRTDRPRISYRDVSNNSLKFASWNGTFWALETVDAQGSVGSYTSLALDSGGGVRVSYRDTSNGDLKFAALDSGECQVFQSSPALAISRVGGDVVISWNRPGDGGTLESTASLSAPDWQPAVGTVENVGPVHSVRVLVEEGRRFYRLR